MQRRWCIPFGWFNMPLKVLVVDDDPAVLRLMSEIFASVEIDVHPMENSEGAARLIAREKFDGIFLDLEMPNIQGYELTRQTRASSWNKTTPVIIVTGQGDAHAMAQAFDAGATFFFQKPIDTQRLLRLFRTTRGPMADNRRRAIRVPLRTPVAYRTSDASGNATSCDVSEHGMLFEGAELHPGENVSLSFSLPTGNVQVTADAEVVRVEKNRRVGVRFRNTNEAGREGIRDLVSALELYG
jgi:CheY-like chemotaxis protein